MGTEELNPGARRRGRVAPGRLETVDLFCGVTLIGALLTAWAGAALETAFLAATFTAMLILRRLELPPLFEVSCAIGILLQGWGNALLLFERIGWYDKAVHFLTPLLMVPSLYLLLVRAGALAPLWGSGLRRATTGVLLVAVALGIALAAGWELVEGSADRWLGTSLAHGYLETIDDLYSSVLGSLGAGGLLAWLVSADRRDLVAKRAPTPVLVERD